VIVNNNYYVNISRINGSQRAIPSGKPDGKVQGSFEEILESKVNENRGLKFSKHAEMRLQLRNIKLTDEQRKRYRKQSRKRKKRE